MADFKLSFETDEGDLLLFQSIAYYLASCFKYSEADSINLIEKYYTHRQRTGPTDWIEWMHHDGPFIMACHIQHTLTNISEDFGMYYRKQDVLCQPKSWGEVIQIIKAKYRE